MRHCFKKSIVLICLLSLLCACTIQENLDVYTFCKVFNKKYKENPISYARMIEVEKQKYIAAEVENTPILIGFQTDDTNAIIELSLTCDRFTTDAENLIKIYNTFLQFASVFTNTNLEVTKQKALDLGLTPEVFMFKEQFIEQQGNQFQISLCANENHLTAYISKRNSEAN